MVEYRTGPRGKKIPVLWLKRREKGKEKEDNPEPEPSWRE